MVWVNCWINEVNGHLMDSPIRLAKKKTKKNCYRNVVYLETKDVVTLKLIMW